MKLHVKLYDLVMAFANALDHVHPALAGHHRRVAFLLDMLGERLNLPHEHRRALFMAGLVHDVGALPLNINISDLLFERDRYRHARAGWLLLRSCPPLRHIAGLVLHHHVHWDQAHNCGLIVRGGCLINFADRIDVMFRRKDDFRQALSNARKSLKRQRSKTFAPHHVEAMADILHDKQNLTWLAEPRQSLPLHVAERYGDIFLGPEQISQFSALFGHVADSFSPFTVTHSTGVACTSRELGALAGMTGEDCDILFVAGMLHDIGKFGVPASLLEKPGPLTDEEFSTVKHHASLSLDWLRAVPGFELAADWGALHHERLDGSGYPHGLKADMISTPSRIVAVADIFTALTEDRPYRKGLSTKDAVGILHDMGEKGHIDVELVKLMKNNAEAINTIRCSAQRKARRQFNALHAACAADAVASELV